MGVLSVVLMLDQINGVSVVRASHQYAVQLIRDTVDQLALTVISVPDTRRDIPDVSGRMSAEPILQRGTKHLTNFTCM